MMNGKCNSNMMNGKCNTNRTVMNGKCTNCDEWKV